MDFDKDKIKLPKLKWLKAKIHRSFSGSIQSAVIERVPSGKYYVSVLVKTEEIALLPKSDKVIAFDLGLKEYLVDSNGNHIPNPKYIKKYENKLAKEQRKLAHKEKGSKNWNK